MHSKTRIKRHNRKPIKKLKHFIALSSYEKSLKMCPMIHNLHILAHKRRENPLFNFQMRNSNFKYFNS